MANQDADKTAKEIEDEAKRIVGHVTGKTPDLGLARREAAKRKHTAR